MRDILNRIDRWILINNLDSQFFEKRIRWQLHSLINYLLYPELRSISLKRVVISNKYLISIIGILFTLLTISFFIGKSYGSSYINKLENRLSNKDSMIGRLSVIVNHKETELNRMSIEVKSRGYLEYKIVGKSKISQINNLRTVPDSIFRLMIEEANRYNIPYVIFFRVMERESKFLFIPNSEGSGAMGYMQVVKSTFNMYYNKLKLKNGHTQGNNIRVAANLIYSIHSFWKSKFKNDRTVWEYSLAEYGCGREPMQMEGGYFIPESVKPGINYVMKYYEK